MTDSQNANSSQPQESRPEGGKLLQRGAKIERIIELPFKKAVEIAMNSMKQRFWRSFITTLLIIAAIAFMMYTSTQNAIFEKLQQTHSARETDFRKKIAAITAEMNQEIESIQKNAQAGTDPQQSRARIMEIRKRAESKIKQTQKDFESWKQLGVKLSDMGIEASNSESRRATSIWLTTLALLVALVGIANAMLMSVTERFKEIGTMKCLGALDSFIIKLFFLESMFQGVSGTVIGIVIGLILVLLYVLLVFGWLAMMNLPALSVLLRIFTSFLIGTLISVVAAILPAWRAATMQPIDALRSDV